LGSDAFARWISELREGGLPVPGWVSQLPIAGEYLDRWWRTNLGNPKSMFEWLRGINLESITAWTSALGGALLHRLFLFLITLIALFVVLRDGSWLANRVLVTADLLLGKPGQRLATKIADAIRGTVNGTVAVAFAEGAVIGIGYGRSRRATSSPVHNVDNSIRNVAIRCMGYVLGGCADTAHPWWKPVGSGWAFWFRRGGDAHR
jgi:predicted PurR-regulated permease PerM